MALKSLSWIQCQSHKINVNFNQVQQMSKSRYLTLNSAPGTQMSLEYLTARINGGLKKLRKRYKRMWYIN